MSSHDDDQPDPLEPNEPARWDAVEVMRRRADQTRVRRDEAIADLRESMTDEEARELFGLDLGEMEK